MIVCVWLPHFALRVIAHRRADLALPLAIGSAAAAHPVVIDCTASARADGVEPGMLVSRAMGACGHLQVLDWDDARIDHAAERFLARLEALGGAVHGLEPGRAFFDSRAVERLYGGPAGVVRAVQQAFARVSAQGDGEARLQQSGSVPAPRSALAPPAAPRPRRLNDAERAIALRVGLGPNPFVAWVAARHAQPGGHLVIEERDRRRVLAGMPASLLPADERFHKLLDALGLRTLGDFAAIASAQVADRFGERGLLLHGLARGDDPRVLSPRRASDPVEEQLEFPEAVANVHTLQRALRMLVERAVGRPQCAAHAPRAVVVVGMLATGGSWQSRHVLRAPMVDPERITLAAQVRLEEVPAPVERLLVRFEQFELREAVQQQLAPQGARQRPSGERAQAGIRHVQAALGDDAMLQVLEVEPWSRVPERHAVLVPRQQVDPATLARAGRGSYE